MEKPKPAQDAKGRFLPGNNGGTGRPKGSRNKLGEQFLADLHADWQQHGVKALQRMRQLDPAAYVRVVAGILPKELDVKDETLTQLTDEELDCAIQAIVDQAKRAGDKSKNGKKTPPRGRA